MALADYISSNFSQVKTQLGWSDSVEIVAITNKALELYGVATEGQATDTKKLHALADVAVWRQARADVILDYNFSADGASYSRSQQFDMIEKSLNDAYNAAIVYMSNYAIGVSSDPDHTDWYA